MTTSTTTGRRRAPRTIQPSYGRTFGTRSIAAPKVDKDKGPSKRAEAAEVALADVLELFTSGDLPERIAETVIARAEGESPAANWSLGNQLLMILAGTADARGYRQWQEVCRHVSKGSKAFYILAPKTRNITEKDKTTGDESRRTIVTGFLGIPVFRYEDTEGLSIEQPDYKPAEFPPLYDVAARLGVTVDYLPFTARFQGYYSPSDKRIVCCSHDTRVFFHELAHAAHDRIRPRQAGVKGQVAQRELVADTVAAVLCHLYGFDGYLGNIAEYLTAYADGQNPGKAALKVLKDVQGVLSIILEGEAASAASLAA
jgi:hypothetical protein